METGALMHSLSLVILVVCLAGFTQGLTGFGFGLVAMPLLPLLMGLKDAVALTVLLNVVVCTLGFLNMHKHYCWREGLGLVVGACFGVPLGVWGLVHLSEVTLLRLLGGIMVFFSLNELLLTRGRSIPIPPRLAVPMGLLSGGLGGAFNMGGPPAIAFTYAQTWSKEQVVAVLQVVFGLSTLLRLGLVGSAKMFNNGIVIAGLASVIPLAIAILVGQRLFARVPHAVLKRFVFGFLGVMGIKYLCSS